MNKEYKITVKNMPRIDVVYDFKKQADEKKGKPGTVFVRVYSARKRNYISTHVRVLPSQWDDVWHVVRHPDAAHLNMMIDEQVKKCKDEIQRALADVPMVEVVAGRIKAKMPTVEQMRIDRREASWLNFVEREIKKNNIGTGTKKHHMTMFMSLCEYGKILRFEDVRPAKIEKWLQFVRQRTVKKMIDGEIQEVKITQAAVHNYWKRFKVYAHIAIGKGLIPGNSLYGIRCDKGESGEREHLTDEEIKKWRTTPMPSAHLEEARLRFIVQMGTGLAYADLMEIDFSRHEKINGYEVLTGRRIKTKKPFFSVALPMAVEVLEKWNWEIPEISNQDYNRYLKLVALRCGIDKKVTSHVGRHTYATYCLTHGVPLEVIQKTLGHTKIATTQIYANMVNMAVLDAFKRSKIK